jgi:hypothetical protein
MWKAQEDSQNVKLKRKSSELVETEISGSLTLLMKQVDSIV